MLNFYYFCIQLIQTTEDMKSFILKSGSENRELVNRFCAFNGDWNKMAIDTKLAFVTAALFLSIKLTPIEQSALGKFVEDGYAKYVIGVYEIVRTVEAGCTIYELFRITRTIPRLEEVDSNTYQHFIEECNDEVTK